MAALPLKPKATAQELSKALSANIPDSVSVTPVPPANLISSAEEDFEIARKSLKDLIEKSTRAIDDAMNLASQTEHPRAYEVVSGMIKTGGDIAGQLIDLHKDRKDLHGVSGESSVPQLNQQNNTFFVGSTTELQKLLKEKSAHAIIPT